MNDNVNFSASLKTHHYIVSVTSHSKVKLGKNELQNVVLRCLKKIDSAEVPDRKLNNPVLITLNDDGSCTTKSGSNTSTLSAEDLSKAQAGEANEGEWSVKPIPFKDSRIRIALSEEKTVQKDWKTFYGGLLARVPQKFFLPTILSPFIWVYGKLNFKEPTIDSSQARAAERLNSLIQSKLPTNPQELIDVLRHHLRYVPEEGSKILKAAIENNEKIQSAIKNGTLEHTLFEISSQLSVDNPLVITSGFYTEEGDFHPVVYTFTKAADGSLSMSSWEVSHESNGGSITEWKLPQESSVKSAIRLVVLHSAAKKVTLGNDKKAQNEVFKNAAGELIQSKQLAEKPVKQSVNPLDVIKTQLESLGAERVVEPAGKAVKAKDSFELCWHMINTFSDQGAPDKVQILIHLINDQVDALVQGLDHLDQSEKLQALKDLDSRLIKLKARMAKVLGGDRALDMLLETGSFSNFKATLESLENARQKILSTRTDESTSILSSKDFEILELGKSQSSPVSASIREDVFITYSPQLSALYNAFLRENAQEAYALYSELNIAVDSLVASGHYEEANKLAIAMQERLPAPNIGDFWSNNVIEPQEIEKWSSLIEKTSHLHWESFTRLQKSHVAPDELVGMMSSRACMIRLLEIKTSPLFSRLSSQQQDKLHNIVYKGQELEAWKAETKSFVEELKLAGFSYEEVRTLLSRNYVFDNSQLSDFLKHHPHIRVNSFPGSAKKAKQLESYFNSIPKKRLLSLGSGVDIPRGYADSDYFYQMEVVGKVFEKKNSSYQSAAQELSASSSGFLPVEIVNLRRHTVISQIMLRPESSLAIHFSSSLKALEWLGKLNKKASEETVDEPSKKEQRAQEIAYQELNDLIRAEMTGRLDIIGSEYLTGESTAVIVNSSNKTKVNFLPWGFGVNVIKKRESDDYAASSLAPVPKKYLSNVSEQDQKKLQKTNDPHAMQRVIGFTETGHLKLSLIEQADIGVIEDYLLRTLGVTTDELMASGTSAVIESLHLICARPSLLSNPEVRGLLDLVFTRYNAFSEILNKDITILQNFNEQLKTVITEQIQAGNVDQAAYLMHIGRLIKNHIDSGGFVSSSWQSAFNSCQDYSQKYQVVGKDGKITEMTGIDYLRSMTVGNENEVGVDEVCQYFLEEIMYENPTENKFKKWVENADSKSIVEFYSQLDKLKRQSEDKTTPFVREGILKWSAEVVNPLLLNKLEQDKGVRDEVLTQMAGVKAGTTWEKDPSTMLYKAGHYEVNLQTRSVKINGSLTDVKSLNLPLPKIAFERFPELTALVHSSKDLKSRQGNQGEIIFSFTSKDGIDYQLSHFKSSGEVILSANFIKSGIAERYQKIYPDAAGFGGASLVKNLGLWVSLENPTRAFVKLDKISHQFPFSQIDVEMDTEGEFQSGFVTIGNHRHSIDFSSSNFKSDFPFATSEDCFFIPETGELVFLHQGMIAKKDGDVWKITQPKSLENLIVGKSDGAAKSESSKRANQLMKALGPEFGMRLHSASKDRVILWPKSITRTSDGISVASDVPDLPLVHVSFTKDGKIEASSGGFMYMAYALAQKREYQLASTMLVLAKQSRMESEQDKQLFKHVADLIRKENPVTTRSMAFQLTAEVALIEIEKQQLSQNAYDPRYRSNYFENIQRLSKMFGQYNSRFVGQKMNAAADSKTLLAEHELSTEVIQQCENFRREAFVDLVSTHTPKRENGIIPSHNLKIVTEKDFTPELLSQIATYTVLPSYTPEQGFKVSDELRETLINPGVLTSEHVLKYFCVYYNEIIKGNMTLEDVQCLFNPIAELVDKSQIKSEPQKEMVNAADVARRMLVQVAIGLHGKRVQALAKMDGVQVEIDMQQLSSLRKDLPKEVLQITPKNVLKAALQAMWDTKSLGEKFVKRHDELINPVNANAKGFLEQILEPIKSGVLGLSALGRLLRIDDPKANGDLLTATGMAQSPTQKVADILPDSIHIAEALENIDEIVVKLGLSELEAIGIKQFLEECKNQTIEVVVDGEKVEKPLEVIPLAQLIDFTDKLGISLIDIRKEQSLRGQIDLLERELLVTKDVSSDYTSTQLRTSLTTYARKFAITEFFGDPPQESKATTKATVGQLETAFDDKDATLSLAEKEEFRNVRKGLKDVVVKRIDPEARINRLLTAEGKSKLEALVARELDPSMEGSAASEHERLKGELLQIAAQCGISSVNKMSENSLINSSEDIINELLQAYQFGNPKLAKYEEVISSFLLWGTAVQQLGNAQAQLNKINSIKDPETLREESRKLCQILDHNLQTTRYGTTLKDPKTYRKFLVAEYRMGIVLQKGQLETILKICEDPHAFYSLRMGEGKTFLIMPIVAAFLAERGILPIMLVPPQLESLNQADFDRTTNKVIGSRAVSFRIELNNTHSAAYLADMYRNLLLTRKTKDYMTSSVPALASLKSLFVQLRDERTKLLSDIRAGAKENGQSVADFLADPKNITISNKYLELNNRLHWIRKIELILDGKLETIGPKGKAVISMPTHLFGDEVDSIYSITDEINRASGNTVPVKVEIRNACSSIFQVLLQLPEPLEGFTPVEASKLKNFQQALLNGNLTALKGKLSNEEFKTQYLKPLAKLLLNNPEFLNSLPSEVKKALPGAMNGIVEYLIGISSSKPSMIKWDKDADAETLTKLKTLSAVKHLLTSTLTSICQIESGLGFKLDSEKGCLAVPSKSGREIEGNRYSDEYELIAFQYVAHIQVNKTQGKNGETKAFYVGALKKLHEINPGAFEALKDRIGVDSELKAQGLYEALAAGIIAKPELWKERLAIVDRFVFDGGMIHRSEEQIPVSAQSVANGPGGVTGTLNTFSLPGFRPTEQADAPSTRQVEAETFFKAAVNNRHGLAEQVHAINDTDPHAFRTNFAEMVNSSTTVAIVNEGGYGLEGKSIQGWVTELRGLFEAGKEQDLVWFDETPNGGTKYYIWEKDQTSFKEITRTDLDARTERFIGIYPPQFTRGADLPLGTGDIHYLPSRSTNPQDAGQSIWRGRGTGNRHTTKFHVPQSIMGDKTWTIGDTYQWMIKRGVQEQLVLNMMAQDFRITNVAPSELRKFFSSFTSEELSGKFSSFKDDAPEITYALTVAEDHLSQLFRDYFVKKKEVDFEADLEPTRKDSTQAVMSKRYDAEIKKIQDKKDLLPQELLAVTRDLISDSNSQQEMIKSSTDIVKKIVDSLKKDKSTPDLKVFAKALCKKDKKLEAAIDNLLKIVEVGNNPSATLEQKNAADEALVMIIGQIFTADLLEAYSLSSSPKSEEERFLDAFESSRQKIADRFFSAGLKSKAKQGDLAAKLYSNKASKTIVKAGVSTANFFVGLKNKMLKIKAPSQIQTPEEAAKADLLESLPGLEDLPTSMHSVLFRFSQASRKLTDIEKQLRDDKKEFNDKFSEYQKHLPEQAESSASTSGKQEQQQQQQQQQIMTLSKTSKAKDRDVEFSSKLENKYTEPQSLSLITDDDFAIEKPSVDWGIDEVWMTREAKKILDLMPRLAGDPWCKICVNVSGQVILLCKQDYHVFSKKSDEENLRMFAPLQKGNVVLKGDKPLTGFEIKRVAVLKLQLGFTEFLPEELDQLKIWWNDLKPENKTNISAILERSGFNIEMLSSKKQN